MLSKMATTSNLLKILTKNQNTEIGKKLGFKGINSVKDYRHKIPLTTFDDYKPYIDRIVERGEQNLLTNKTVVKFAPSSGTTGKVKLIPRHVEDVVKTANSPIKPFGDLSRVLIFSSFPTKYQRTPSEMIIESAGAGMIRNMIESFPSNSSAPYEAYGFDSLQVALRLQLVFGLKDARVSELLAIFIPTIISALTELKTKWRQTLTDIRSGKIDPALPIPSEKRDVLEGSLGGPDPVRADELEKIFEEAEKSNYKEILSTIWPDLDKITSGCSGNMASFIPTVKYYIGPHVHISSMLYGCSECGSMGIAAKPGQVTSLFHLVPHVFFEFIPLDKVNSDNPRTLLASEVQEGQIYEIVITTPSGFYRYRNGDYIKVIEQGEDGPLIDLYGRGKMTLHVRDHTLYEANMEMAMMSLTSTTSSRVDYIASVDKSTYSRYKIWMEHEHDVRPDLEKFIDEKLQSVDILYKFNRDHNRVEQVMVVKVKPGTFSKIMELLKNRTHNPEIQLKIPRMVIEDESIQQILEENLY